MSNKTSAPPSRSWLFSIRIAYRSHRPFLGIFIVRTYNKWSGKGQRYADIYSEQAGFKEISLLKYETMEEIGMDVLRFVLISTVVCFIPGCQTLPELTLYEVDADRQRLHAKGLEELKKVTKAKDDKKFWIQPVNKKVKCLLPSGKSFLEEDGHFAIWDGRCKNGYAHGFGRDIAISDRTHVEEITVHDAKDDKDQIIIHINYIDNLYVRAKKIGGYDSKNFIGQYVTKQMVDGNVKEYRFRKVYSKEGYAYYMDCDGVYPRTIFSVNYPKYSLIWIQSKFPLDNVREKILTYGEGGVFGPVLDVYANGRVITTFNDQMVKIPSEYWQSVRQEYVDFGDSMRDVDSVVQEADQLLRQYKAKVCNNPNQRVPKGITKDQFMQICQFEEKMFKELPELRAEYQIQLNQERMHLNQERMIQAQEEQARAQAEAAEAAKEANRIARQPINCIRIGNFVNCY